MHGLAEQRRLEPPGGAKPKRTRYGAPIPQTPGTRGQLLGTGAQPVGSGDGQFAFEMPNQTGADKQLPPGPDRQLSDMETQSVNMGNNRSMFGLASPTYPGPGTHQLDTETQPVRPAFDRFTFGMPTQIIRDQKDVYRVSGNCKGLAGLADMTDSGSRGRLPGKRI